MAVQTNDLEGRKLLEAVALASGLPEDVAHEALNTVLDHRQRQKADSEGLSSPTSDLSVLSHDTLTIDELRAAMLEFLEAVNKDVMDSHRDSHESESQGSESDVMLSQEVDS